MNVPQKKSILPWNDHHEYEGKHAFLGASQNAWLNWDNVKLLTRYTQSYVQSIGTVLHELAKDCIKARMKLTLEDYHLLDYAMLKAFGYPLPKDIFDSKCYIRVFAAYVNDAIKFHMTPEVILFYSKNCFGTTDSIIYDSYSNTLRIHDYKSGDKEAKFTQLVVYAAYACLEYNIIPSKTTFILRIYQEACDEDGNINELPYKEMICPPQEVELVMERTRIADNIINAYKENRQ